MHATLITFRVRHSRGEMYIAHDRLCVCVCACLSRAAFLHYCMGLNVTLGNGRVCPLVVHYWADSQLVHGFRCHGNRCVCTVLYNTVGRRCNANVYRSTLMLYGQLPVKFSKALHRTRNVSECRCARSMAGLFCGRDCQNRSTW